MFPHPGALSSLKVTEHGLALALQPGPGEKLHIVKTERPVSSTVFSRVTWAQEEPQGQLP